MNLSNTGRPALSLYAPTSQNEDDFEILEDDFDTLEALPDEKEAKPQVWSSYFLDDLKCQAKKFMKHFFAKKSWYCGGKIDPDQIISGHYVELVLNTELEHGVQMVYDHWHTAALGGVSMKDLKKNRNTGDVPADIEAVLAVQRECNALGIPKAFRGGITMMYFEFCEGFDYSTQEATYSLGVA